MIVSSYINFLKNLLRLMRHKKNNKILKEKTKKLKSRRIMQRKGILKPEKLATLKYEEKITTLRTFRVRHWGIKLL